MSVIQQIQEKYAKLMAIVIAIALIIFVVMLAFENGGSLFSGKNSTTIGKVNGTSIDYNDFMKKVDQTQKNLEQQYAQYGGTPPNLQQQAMDAAWSQEINDILQNKEMDRLGITVGKREMGDMLYGPNAPEAWKRFIMRSDTGVWNGPAAKAEIDRFLRKKTNDPQELSVRDQIIAYINGQQQQRLSEKYISLMSNSVNYPKWLVEKQIDDDSKMATISLVRAPYADYANDSTIKVSDKEIQDYIDKHKEDFKQEESRSIAYVAFSARASAADSAAARNRVAEMKVEFDTTTNVEPLLTKQGLAMPANYVQSSGLPISVKDTISKLPVNAVYGPYIDNGSYTLAKLIGTRREAEMVRVRHILISTATRNPQNPQQMIPTREDAQAKHLADSIQKAIESGSNFDSLAVKFSEDNPTVEDKPRNKFKFGVYDSVKHGAMVPEFDNFIFGNPVGSKGVVKTEYGYHYIEVLGQKGTSFETYKVAYLTVPVESSTETEVSANNDANQFAANSRDQKSFDANAEKLSKERGINKNIANEIPPSSQQVGTLSDARALVRKIYDAKLGEVLEPLKADDSYVVAIVTEINKEGTKSVAKARPLIESILRNKKVAEKIKQKIGNVTTLEAAAAAAGGKPIETVDSIRMRGMQINSVGIAGVGNENKVIGAAFNPANKGKVVTEAIEGAGGVYVIRVDDVVATSVANANVDSERQRRYAEGKQQAAYRSPIQALREAATIKDKRVKFF